MRLLLAFSTLFGVVGCLSIFASVCDRLGHSHDQYACSLSTEPHLRCLRQATVDGPFEAASTFESETETHSVPSGPPCISVVLFVRSPEVLRNLIRLAMIAVQFWRGFSVSAEAIVRQELTEYPLTIPTVNKTKTHRA
jgi:hypothetical protein